MDRFVVAVLVAALVLSAFAMSHGQTRSGPSISGRVLDEATGEPLEFVNVFIANTTSGTSTGADGRYTLSNIRPGPCQVVASRVGHSPETVEVEVGSGGSFRCDFRLRARELRSEEVEVYGREPLEWKRNLELFRKAFIGQTDNALLCTMRNPEILNFRIDGQTGLLSAATDSSLVVENRSLGYRITVVLESFEWDVENDVGRFTLYPKFEELTPVSDQERGVWLANRQKTYDGSLKHFLTALRTGKFNDEMFAVYSGPLNALRAGEGQFVTPDEFRLLPDPVFTTLNLSFSGWLRIDYKKRIPALASFLKLDHPYARVDTLGNVLTPLALIVGGVWGKSRLADMLPLY